MQVKGFFYNLFVRKTDTKMQQW